MSSNPKGRTTIEVGADGVAVITIINPPVNSLSLDGTLNQSIDLTKPFLKKFKNYHFFTIIDKIVEL